MLPLFAPRPLLSGRSHRHGNSPAPVLRVEAPPASSPAAVPEDEVEVEEGESKFTWRDHWYPVSLVKDLDPKLSTLFQLLGREIVLWKDPKSGDWVGSVDKCTHRLAHLSEGRIDFALMENVSNPSHIDFAPHKVTRRRDRAKPLPFMVESIRPWGFAGSNDGRPRISAKFIAPSYYMKIDTKLPVVGEQTWKIWICSFNILMASGKTRSIVFSVRNCFQFVMPGPVWWQLVPRWHEHWTSTRFMMGYDCSSRAGENIFIPI